MSGNALLDSTGLRKFLGTPEGRAAAQLSLYRRDFRRLAAEQLRVKTKPPNPQVVLMSPLLAPQEEFLRSVERQKEELGDIVRQVWLKARQQGGSTLAEALTFHRAGLSPNINALTVANDKPTAENLFRIIKLFHESLDPAIRPKTRYNTKRDLTFEDEAEPDAGLRSSYMVDTANNVDVGVSRTITMLHLSEVARYGKAEKAISSVLGSIPLVPGTSIIMESTAYVMGAYFKSMVERARRQEGAWRFCFVPWTRSPEYSMALAAREHLSLTRDEQRLVKEFGLTLEQLKWRRFKIAEMKGDEIAFMMDFPLTVEEAFVTLGYSIFRPTLIRKLALHVKPPVRRCEIFPERNAIIDIPGGNLWIWESPHPNADYDIAADVSLEDEGDEIDPDDPEARQRTDDAEAHDFSTIQVVRRGSLEQAAEWKGRVAPIRLAEMLNCLGYYYNTAQVAPEVRGIGIATSGHLSTVLRYPNLHRWRYRDRVQLKLSPYAGWDTGWKAKQYLIAFALSVVGSRVDAEPLIHSERLLDEIKTFIRSGYASYEAASGYHDDLVMAWLIALVTSNDEDFSKFVDEEESKTAQTGERFYEPGKAPKRTDVDPAYTDADADADDFRLIGGATEVDGWS